MFFFMGAAILALLLIFSKQLRSIINFLLFAWAGDWAWGRIRPLLPDELQTMGAILWVAFAFVLFVIWTRHALPELVLWAQRQGAHTPTSHAAFETAPQSAVGPSRPPES